MKLHRQHRRNAARIEPLESRIAPATFLVLNTNDSGFGSLRQAILDANATSNSGGPDVISFANIPASGPFVIQPLSPLPAVTEALIIDGYTAPGTSQNTLPVGTNAVLRVEIDASLQGNGHGLVLAGSGGSTVTGLVIRGTPTAINDSGHGVAVRSDNNVVAGNFIGTDVTGTLDFGNRGSQVSVGLFTGTDSFTGNVIGGGTPAARNILSGGAFGISLTDDSFGTVVQGNLIGTDRTGNFAIPNNNAGIAGQGVDTLIGGNRATEGNVISGNDGWGINFSGTNTTIQGNIIGLNAAGNAPLPNTAAGINFSNGASVALVGGGALSLANVIAGNDGDGIQIGSSFGDGPGDDITVRGNFIGTDASGAMPLGNRGAGIGVYATSRAMIGGLLLGQGNVIAFNAGHGVFMQEIGTVAGVTVSGNAIHSNGGLGINLSGGRENFYGVTANESVDDKDKDAGPNGLQNYPVGTNFLNTGSSVTLEGFLFSKANAGYRLEFFAMAPSQVDLSAHGEGVVFLGSQTVTTNADGEALFNFSAGVSLPLDTWFTATATDLATGETSEFSQVFGPALNYTWTGAVDTDWFNPGNWSAGAVPGPLDSVLLLSGAIELTRPVTVQTFIQSGGSLGGSAGELNILGTWTWTGGTHSGGTLRLIEGAAGGLNGATALQWLGGDLDAFGNLTVGGAGVAFESGTLSLGGVTTLDAGFVDNEPINSPVTAFNTGELVKNNAGTFGFAGMTLVNFGSIFAQDGTLTAQEISLQGGAIQLAGGAVSVTTQIELQFGVLSGGGIITGNVVNSGGTVIPGGDFLAAILQINGNYTQTAGGTLAVDIGGQSQGSDYDALLVSGTALLDGTLQYRVINNYLVRAGDSFSIVDAATGGGAFIVQTGQPPLVPFYSGGDAQLSAPGIFVTNTNDSGPGSLRQAILDANAMPGLQFINFNIPGGGVQTISPLSLLPAITDPVVIDGYTQPGASLNTQAVGSDAVLLIEINGENIPAGPGTEYGLRVDSGGSYISGLVINRVDGYGIILNGSGGSTIVGNWIGPTATGMTAPANSQFGILVDSSANNRIGSGDPRDRNVISGNDGNGIEINRGASTGTIIQGNYIGVAADGVATLGNSQFGIFVGSGVPGATIGGVVPGEGNVIASNFEGGVLVSNGASGITIRGNSIFANSGIAIDLRGAIGPDANDMGDGDGGGNNLVNFPVVNSLVPGVMPLIRGTYDGLPNTTFIIDLYASTAADPAGSGPGGIYLGSQTVTTGPDGLVNFDIVLGNLPAGFVITATATQVSTGDTSEFSPAFTPATGMTYVWDNGAGDGDWFNPINWDLDAGVPGVNDTAILNIASTINLLNNVTVGTFQQRDGTVTGGGNMTINTAFTWSGGTQSGTGTLFIGAGATATLSGADQKTLDRRSIENAGTVSITDSGNLSLHGGAAITNLGMWDFQSDADVVQADTTDSFFVNAAGATLRKSAGTAAAATVLGLGNANLTFNHSGTVEVIAGTLTIFGAGGTWSGSPSVTVSANSTLGFTGGAVQWDAAPALTGGGTLDIGGGTTLTLGAGTTVTIPAGFTLTQTATLTGAGDLVVNGVWNLSGTVGGTGQTLIGSALNIVGNTVLDGRALVILGGTVLQSANLELRNIATIANNLGLWDLLGNFNVTGAAGGGAFLNGGQFVKSGGSGTAAFDALVPFTNVGLVQSAIGTLAFNGGFTQTGISNPSLQLAGGNLAGSTFVLNVGELRGSGTVAANVINNAAHVIPGMDGTAGVITITGDFTQASTGALKIDLGGTNGGEFDVLSVGGIATLDGRMEIANVNGFVPQIGDSFQIIVAGSDPGTFPLILGDTVGIIQTSDASGLVITRGIAVYTWDAGGGVDTDWFNPLNWDFDIVPMMTDIAVIDTPVTVSLGADTQVGVLRLVDGMLEGGGRLTAINGIEWDGGTISTPLITGPGANNVIGGTTTKTLVGATVTLGGATTMGANVTILGGAELQNNGDFEFTNGADILGPGTFHHLIGASGLVTKTDAGDTDISATFLNGAGLGIQLGTFRLSGGGNWAANATVTTASGATLEFAGGFHTLAGGHTFSGTGTTLVSGGTVILNGAASTVSTGAVFRQTGGTQGGDGALDVSGFYEWVAGTQTGLGITTILDAGSAEFSGVGSNTFDRRLSVSAGATLLVSGNGVVNFSPLGRINVAGTLEFTSEGSFDDSGVPGSLVQVLPGGMVRMNSRSTFAMGIEFVHEGSLLAEAGNLRFGRGFTQIAGETVLNGGSLQFLTTAQLQGGELRGSGNIVGSINNTGATIRPGSSPGILNIDGDLTLGAATRIVIEIGGPTTSDFDQILLTGSLNLGGTLEAELINDFVPSPGSSFPIMLSGLVTGAFGNVDVAPLLFSPGPNGIVLAAGSPVVVPPKDPVTFTDGNGDLVKVLLTGKGSLSILLDGGATDNANIFSIALLDTDLTSKLSVVIANRGAQDRSNTTVISHIFTTGERQHVGSITLGDGVTLGDGAADADPELRVTGKINSLVLDDLAANTFIKLGEDLPYDLPGKKEPDTLNNLPKLIVGDVRGTGVVIENIGDGTPGGVGGGGFSKVVFHSWAFHGFLRTTQGIGSLLIKTGDFFGVLEVDKFHNGEQTTANIGSMEVAEGSWGSSGSEIEGNIGSFDVEAFLAAATITAGSIGSVKSTGPLAGTFILTDPDSPAVPTFTVNSDFSARVVSATSIKKLKIKGDFTGSLEAPSIGSISAFSFLGNAMDTEIITTSGKLGRLTSSTGVFRDYQIVTNEAFTGITVKGRKLGAETVGIDNVSITAASIGDIFVDLAVGKNAGGVNLFGIRNSEFITTSTDAGSIGKITVKLKGGMGGSGSGILDTSFDSRVLNDEFTPGSGSSTTNPIGDISVKLSGFGAASAGLTGVSFEANIIGKTTVLVTPGGGTAQGAKNVSFLATDRIRAMKLDGSSTLPMAENLTVLAGGRLDSLTIRSKTTPLGNLEGGSILAGQSLALTGTDKDIKSALAASALGKVSISGSLVNSTIAGGGDIGPISIGAATTDSLILAGTLLGTNAAFGGGDDVFRSAATIAGIVVKGPITRTSIASGVDPVNGVFGDSDDMLAPAAGTLPGGSIGKITLGIEGSPAAASAGHAYAIQAAAIKSLKTNAGTFTDFAIPSILDNAPAGENDDDILIRVL